MQNKNQIYVIGGSKSEFQKIEQALSQEAKKKSTRINVTHLTSDFNQNSFPRETNNAIILTEDGLNNLTKEKARILRTVSESTTSRIYLSCSTTSIPQSQLNLIEDFIQRSDTNDLTILAEQIIKFLNIGNSLAWLNNKFGIRDNVCLSAFKILKPFWSISYIAAFFHVINSAYLYFSESEPFWSGFLSNSIISGFATFFGLFFCVHAIYSLIRNSVLAITVAKRGGIGLLIPALFFLALIGLVYNSITTYEKSSLHLALLVGLAAFLYWFYLYCLKIRAECTSLSEIHESIANPYKKDKVASLIGNQRLMSSSFPFFGQKSRMIFISNMHKSSWSFKSAEKLATELEDMGKQVFLDRSSIASASLWRRLLLRALSECTDFVALLDGDHLEAEWVFAESAYAALLRKNIAKPKILLVFENQSSMNKIKNSSYGELYRDVFEIPQHQQLGAGILITDNEKPSASMIIEALGKIKQMKLI